MKKQYQLFIFDFDGTLANTEDCIVSSFQDSLKKHNLPEAERESIVRLTGISLPEMFKRVIGRDYPEELYGELVTSYRTSYGENLATKTTLYPGIKDLIQEIKDAGATLTIATSKKTEIALLNVRYLGIADYFSLIVGDDMVTNKKPDPEMLTYTLSQLHIPKEQAIMVGDSIFDIQMGNAIGMDTCAVTWGAHTVDMFTRGIIGQEGRTKEMTGYTGPTYVVTTVQELKALL